MNEDFINFSSALFSDDESFNKVFKRNNHDQVSMLNVKAPWLLSTKNIDLVSPPLIRFHNEILSFTQFISPTNKELFSRDNLLKELSSIVANLWPMVYIHYYYYYYCIYLLNYYYN
jgi:DNA polymerase sigma